MYAAASLAERLLGRGYQLRIYDKHVSSADPNQGSESLTNRHLMSVHETSAKELVETSELVVLAGRAPEYAEALAKYGKDKVVVDLVRMPTVQLDGYQGVCW